MLKRLMRSELFSLADVEPTPEEAWNELYREWKQAELEDLWRELKRIESVYLRRLYNRKRSIEQTVGIRLKARVPKNVIEPPVTIARSLEED